MNIILEISKDPLFGLFITVLFFEGFKKLNEIFKIHIFNPLVFSIVFIIIFLKVFNIPYENYYKGAEIFNTLIVPATVALAIPLYKNFGLLKKHYKEILISIGVSTLVLTFMLGFIIGFLNIDVKILASMLPKSVTTAIAVGVSEKINGLQSVTVIIVILCGNIGAMFGETIFKIFKIHNPIAQGISLGTTSHAVGTSKAMSMGEVQGSMSGLAIIITGIFIVILAPIVFIVISNIFYI